MFYIIVDSLSHDSDMESARACVRPDLDRSMPGTYSSMQSLHSFKVFIIHFSLKKIKQFLKHF